MPKLPQIPEKFIAVILYTCLFLSAAFTTFVVISLRKNIEVPKQHAISLPVATPAPTPKPKTQYSILLLGRGGAGHDGGGLADTIILLTADKATKKAATISVPRDTFYMNQKINNTYAIGGGILAKQAVQEVTGLDVDYFVSIDFGGFERAIDTLEGIDVLVPVAFDDYFYPIKGKEDDPCGMSAEQINQIVATTSGYLREQQFTCRYEHLHFDQGVTHMDGVTALKFVRSRHSEQHGGDFARSQRQEAVLKAVSQKALSLGALKNIPAFFNQFSSIINTDLDANVIKIFYEMLGDPANYTQKRVSLTTENVFNETYSSQGAYILIPKAGVDNFGPIHDFIRNEMLR